jgi:hypothetical protein
MRSIREENDLCMESLHSQGPDGGKTMLRHKRKRYGEARLNQPPDIEAVAGHSEAVVIMMFPIHSEPREQKCGTKFITECNGTGIVPQTKQHPQKSPPHSNKDKKKEILPKEAARLPWRKDATQVPRDIIKTVFRLFSFTINLIYFP